VVAVGVVGAEAAEAVAVGFGAEGVVGGDLVGAGLGWQRGEVE
jgi:hypothetical protein